MSTADLTAPSRRYALPLPLELCVILCRNSSSVSTPDPARAWLVCDVTECTELTDLEWACPGIRRLLPLAPVAYPGEAYGLCDCSCSKLMLELAADGRFDTLEKLVVLALGVGRPWWEESCRRGRRCSL